MKDYVNFDKKKADREILIYKSIAVIAKYLSFALVVLLLVSNIG